VHRKTADIFFFYQNSAGIKSRLLKISQLVAIRKVPVLPVCIHWMKLVASFDLATSVVTLLNS